MGDKQFVTGEKRRVWLFYVWKANFVKTVQKFEVKTNDQQTLSYQSGGLPGCSCWFMDGTQQLLTEFSEAILWAWRKNIHTRSLRTTSVYRECDINRRRPFGTFVDEETCVDEQPAAILLRRLQSQSRGQLILQESQRHALLHVVRGGGKTESQTTSTEGTREMSFYLLVTRILYDAGTLVVRGWRLSITVVLEVASLHDS